MEGVGGPAMSVSARILWFAVVAIGVTCALAISSMVGAQTGRRIRERVVASQEQMELLGRLDDSIWPYLNALSRARQSGQDTLGVLREMQAQVTEQQSRFLASTRQEERGGEQELQLHSGDQEEASFTQVSHAVRGWMERTEARLRQEPQGTPIAPALEWQLYQEYEQQVGHSIASLQEEEGQELARLRGRWDAIVDRLQSTSKVIMLGCGVLLMALALSILVPLRGSLRKLRSAAERVGRGDFEVALPEMGRDELGLLAHAMNRMAVELRDTLQEKQRLVRAEAEASEREARRYSAMLEETVHARTTELEASNARLAESLRQLELAQEQLLFADRLATVGRLAAGVGHEINNPLSYILSNLRYIQQGLHRVDASSLPDREELLGAAVEAHDGAERVHLIVQSLRTLSRPDDVALGPVELGGVVRGATKIAAQELKDRARLVEDCEGVPAAWGNGPRLGQVLLNLLINAGHAIDPGRVEENEVRVVARTSGSASVILEVRDTGCGIPPENLERIFEPFFTTKPVGVGTGLGLSVCRNLVSSMGGTLEVESQVGRGTTFRITLPTAEGRNPGEGEKKSA
jgi:two-component system NtrC family sensor kinase